MTLMEFTEYFLICYRENKIFLAKMRTVTLYHCLYHTKSELQLSCHGCLQASQGADKALMVVVISVVKWGCQALNQKLNLPG